MPQVKSDRALKEKEKKASQRRGSAILIQKALKKNIEKKRESNKQEKKRRDSAVLIAQVRTDERASRRGNSCIYVCDTYTQLC